MHREFMSLVDSEKAPNQYHSSGHETRCTGKENLHRVYLPFIKQQTFTDLGDSTLHFLPCVTKWDCKRKWLEQCSFLHLYPDQCQGFAEIGLLSLWFSISQGVPLGDFLLAPARVPGNSRGGWPLFNIEIPDWWGGCIRQGFCLNWRSKQGPGIKAQYAINSVHQWH